MGLTFQSAFYPLVISGDGGGGGSSSEQFSIQVNTYSDLISSYPASGYSGKIALVLFSEGILLAKKPKGIYYSDGSTWDWKSDYVFAHNDSETFFHDDIDTTKLARFELSGISSSTTRIFSLPDKDGTIAMLSDIATSVSVLPSYPSFPSGAFEGQTIWHEGAEGVYTCTDETGDTTLATKWRRLDKIELSQIITPIGETGFLKADGSGGVELIDEIDGGEWS